MLTLQGRSPSCICGPNDDTMIPKGSTKLDYEIELGIIIGSRARYLAKNEAMDVVAGYCLANDVSERLFQIERAGQWTKGKGCETFGPLGPWLVTKDEIKNPQDLDMWLDVNGEKRQRGNTSTMIFDCRHIVWTCSQYFVMEPGDVIITGTPPGVGLGIKPEPKFLKAGDLVALGIEGLRELCRVEARERDFGCARPNTTGEGALPTPPSGISKMANTARARDAALTIVEALKKPLQTTSPASTSPKPKPVSGHRRPSPSGTS